MEIIKSAHSLARLPHITDPLCTEPHLRLFLYAYILSYIINYLENNFRCDYLCCSDSFWLEFTVNVSKLLVFF